MRRHLGFFSSKTEEHGMELESLNWDGNPEKKDLHIKLYIKKKDHQGHFILSKSKEHLKKGK